ncbi:M42 family metallopeptidase [uncultured Thermanaerothrix sp.]|uniref:M42 family metallopeptidase n=1 Tax=uncultured Thermanaerothrix sp. TaxID=1195149 RepID=UPI002614F2C0|nr:M42 family metallopeptidase [uncultured Thermanaerothrix sp.]
MMNLPDIHIENLLDFLTGLLNTPSPTGFTDLGMDYVERALCQLEGVRVERTPKGALLARLEGEIGVAPWAVVTHVDTLGAMVKEIKPNGRLKMTSIGGFAWNTVESEGCTVFTHKGQRYRGSILVTAASSHVHGKRTAEAPRDAESMEVRLDARTQSAEETQALGVEVGDFIAFDPRVEVNEGFVRSRHLDNKAGVACVVAAMQTLVRAHLKPRRTLYALFSNYEEVGHGASAGLPADLSALIVVDMAAVGEGQTSDEFHATLCVKDSHGPYDRGLSLRLRHLAEQYQVPYKVDIYPNYGSDGGAFWRAGGNAPVALIGPGVDASHNYERTHVEALVATTRWLLAYALNA